MSQPAPDLPQGCVSLAIMQPYLFPYLGYYQLVASAQTFVFLDDVNFIKRGWINRNRLMFSRAPRYFTVPLSNASQFRKISEIEICYDANWQKKMLSSISQSYSKAPYFKPTFELVSDVLNSGEKKISEMAKASILAISSFLDLPTKFIPTSSIYSNAELKAADRIIDICHKEQASLYLNLPSGASLYDSSTFLKNGINLSFISPPAFEYDQGAESFQPSLSIIDVLMFNPANEINNLLLEKQGGQDEIQPK